METYNPKRRLNLGNRIFLLYGLIIITAAAAVIYGASSRTSEASNDESLAKSPQAEPGAVNQGNYALQFDGTDDFARAIDIGNFDFDTTFTVEAWVRPDSVTGPSVLKGFVSGRFNDQPDSGGGWVMSLPADDHSRWGMSVCTPNCQAPSTQPGALIAGEWQHLAATYDGAAIKIYHNGVLTDTAAHLGNVTDVNYLFLGAWRGTFCGTGDEFRVGNVARTPGAILSTMFAPLQGSEAGLVGYWPLDDGTGQFASDASGNGQLARLGSSDGDDSSDPLWVESDSPVLEPLFQLIPNLGGLGTDIGVSSVIVPGFNCGWVSGETVEIWWDLPEARLATITVEDNGCFERLVNLDDVEIITGSEPGEHVVQARGSLSGNVAVPFVQTISQLHLHPAQGVADRDVAVDGCGWDGSTRVNVFWQYDNTLLVRADIDAFTGCINDTVTIPRASDGFYTLLAFTDEGLISAAAYWVQSPTILLTPNEGPPGARVPLAGCGWLPQEQIDFAFSSDGVVFDTWGTSIGGCITTGGPTEPTLAIPETAALGAMTIQATGQDSGYVVNTPFTVITRSLAFDPESGLPGDSIATSGCGWVGNEQVTVEWGYPDTNGLPIRWIDGVEHESGCFGEGGNFIIQVPDNTINGPVVITATGDTIGMATATFTVTHSGYIEIPNSDGYAGAPMTVNIFDASIGETITFRWDVGYAFDGVGAAVSDFSYDITLPKYASVGLHTVTADGTKGFNDQATVNVLDRAEIVVVTGGDIYPGSTIRVEGIEWAAGEIVQFDLRSGSNTWPIAGSVTVETDSTTFSELISLPEDIPSGSYTLWAEGNKGRDASTGLTITAAPAPSFSLDAAYANPPPVLDGQPQRGEWDYGQRINFAHGFLSARSDDSRLYILLDLLGDTGQNSLGADNFWLSFDVWKNGQIDSGFDLNFRLDGSGDMILEEYTGPNSFTPRNSTFLRSAYGAGYGCFFSDGSLSFSLINFIPNISCSRHRTWEVAIDLATIGAQAGGSVRLGVKAISQSPAFSDEIPPGFPADFSELGRINLADSKLPADPPDGRVLGIGSDGFEIEVTQAIQDASNSMSLVADKETVVRVYPDVEAESTVRTFLFGQRNGQDLPGSPLEILATVPYTIDREALSHTANFLLPDSWATAGLTQFTAVVENLDGQNTKADTESAIFYERDVPVIWVFPFNEGTAAAPLLPTQADMVEQEQVLSRLLPTPSVTFVHRPWTEIGTTNPISFTTMKKELSRYYSALAAAATSSNNLSSLPDMLFGFKVGRDPKAVGTSDPIYAGGSGIVVVGQADGSDFNSTTMIHEVNHNLDRSHGGTWGRHVANPDDDDDDDWGCGADGPDPAWPHEGNDNIQEVGFDSTTPWTDGEDEHKTVVPDTRDDFMSYCWQRGTPIQWISPYRWQAMFNRFVPVPSSRSVNASTVISDVYYLSGQVNLDGSGTLDPLMTMPGVVAAPLVSGTYSIEIEDGGGTTVYSTTFTAVFTDAEGVELDSVFFDYQLPAQAGAAKILLKHDGVVLDTIMPSANTPTVTVTSPADGDSWGSQETIRWTAGDADGDELLFSIFYSPDAGDNWYPVAVSITGTEYEVDVTHLPGGDGGVVRVVASDGFHTVQAESAGAFSVPPPAPVVVIDSPAEGASYLASNWINLSGRATDAAAAPAEVFTYTWAVDGQLIDVGQETALLLDHGQYTITLTAYDALGNYGQDSVTINVWIGTNRVYMPVMQR